MTHTPTSKDQPGAGAAARKTDQVIATFKALPIGLSAFVGAGLVFAGVTDTCGMGMMLARMPWNQVKETTGLCCAKKEVRS